MKYKIKVINKDGSCSIYKTSNNKYIVYDWTENKKEVDKNWIVENIIEIDNVRLSSDFKLYLCKSKQETVIRYIIDLVKKKMKSKEGFNPNSLVRISKKWFERNNDGLFYLNKNFDLSAIDFIENRIMKSKKNIDGASLDAVIALLVKYCGYNSERDCNIRYNGDLLETIIFTAVAEFNEIARNSVLMMINGKTEDRIFFAKSSYEEATRIYDRLYNIDSDMWMNGTCGIDPMRWNFYGKQYFEKNKVEVGYKE